MLRALHPKDHEAESEVLGSKEDERQVGDREQVTEADA